MNLGYDSERNLCAGHLEMLQSHWYSQQGSHCYWEEINDADVEAEFVIDSEASSELKPKNEQEIVEVVSFNHWFQALSSTNLQDWEMLLFLADLHHYRLPDTEVCHQQGQRNLEEMESGRLLSWLQFKSE